MNQKRIVTVQDISCFGKCSLTVALPVISAMGIECCVIPTAVLSTHTGGFTGYTWRDLTEDIEPISRHWQKYGLRFDSVYTGYLGSDEQVDILSRFFDAFHPAKIYVDPVMGDNGKLYTGFTPDFAKKMAQLCQKADVTVPNLTEATYMLGMPYPEDGYDRDYIKNILQRLTSELGCPSAVITGVLDGERQGAVAYNRESDGYISYFSENIPVKFHGTGDVFSSTFFGALTLGRDMPDALRIAVEFTVGSIRESLKDDRRYGVNFESQIGRLTEMIK